MKLLATLHALFLFVGLTYAQQNIFPLAVDTPKWCMVSTNYNGGNPMFFYHTSNYSYQKDTLAEGKLYSKLTSSFPRIAPCLIRNEGKKTFIRRSIPDQIPLSFANETLLYNFNMRTVRDSIVVVSSNMGFPFPIDYELTVKFVSADSISFLGSQRRRLKVVYFKKNGGYHNAEWIEGYGDLKNPFYDCYYCSDTWVRTMKLEIKGQAVHQDSTIANGCSPKRVGVSDPILTQVSVFPNPASNAINVNYNLVDKFEDVHISLFDFTGREIKRQKLVTNQSQVQWQTDDMQTGLYLIAIYADNRLVWKTKVYVQK